MGCWRFSGGHLGSGATADHRRTFLRAGPLAPDAWWLALVTGFVGFGGLVLLLLTMARLMAMPESAPLTTPVAMPAFTWFLLLVMSSVVAGVTVWSLTRLWLTGRPEWQLGTASPQGGTAGLDAAFWMTAAGTVFVAALFIYMCRMLATKRQNRAGR